MLLHVRNHVRTHATRARAHMHVCMHHTRTHARTHLPTHPPAHTHTNLVKIVLQRRAREQEAGRRLELTNHLFAYVLCINIIYCMRVRARIRVSLRLTLSPTFSLAICFTVPCLHNERCEVHAQKGTLERSESSFLMRCASSMTKYFHSIFLKVAFSRHAISKDVNTMSNLPGFTCRILQDMMRVLCVSEVCACVHIALHSYMYHVIQHLHTYMQTCIHTRMHTHTRAHTHTHTPTRAALHAPPWCHRYRYTGGPAATS